MSSLAHDIATPLSDLLETTLKEGPQVVTKDGVERAVLVPIDEWREKKPESPSPVPPEFLGDPLLDRTTGPLDIIVPPRGRFNLRPPFKFED
jgi:antitoxin Phd